MDKRIEDELAQVLYKQGWVAMSTIFMLIVILDFILVDVVPIRWLLIWSAINIVTNLSFLASLVLYHKNPDRHSSATWITIYTLHALFYGLLWSPIGPLTLHYGNFEYQIFILFIFAGLAAGSIGSRGVLLKIFLADVLFLLLPVFIYLVIQSQPLYNIMASLVVIYFFALLFIVKNYSQTTIKTINLLIHNEDLVNELTTTNNMLEQSNEKLHTEIQNRIEVEKKLNQDKLKAEKTGTAKSRFVANMSHEFRTPLNAIIGFGELLSNTPLNRKQSEYVNNIIISSNHLIDLVNDVLDIARIEAGKIRLEYNNVDIYSIVDKVINITLTSAINKGLYIIKEIDTSVPRIIYIDEIRIRQILLNFINNAIKFTETGYIKLAISFDEKSSEIKFDVEDTGIGISKQNQQDLFNAFSQLENFEMKRQEGAGLGLTISRSMTELMHGKVEIKSEVGEGSIFSATIPVSSYERVDSPFTGKRCYVAIDDDKLKHAMQRNLEICGIEITDNNALTKEDFYICETEDDCGRAVHEYKLPPSHIIRFQQRSVDNKVLTPAGNLRQINILFGLDDALAQEQAHAAGSVKPHSDNIAEKSIKRILIADDNKLNRLVIINFLEDMNIKAFEAENGHEVLDILDHEQDIDLILMDIQMPVVSGIEATQIIREQIGGRIGKIPIVAVTAHAMPEYRRHIMARGFNDCLVKPISKEQLLDIVEKWSLP